MSLGQFVDHGANELQTIFGHGRIAHVLGPQHASHELHALVQACFLGSSHTVELFQPLLLQAPRMHALPRSSTGLLTAARSSTFEAWLASVIAGSLC
jgi:hypothetical protein